ncbi:MAG: tail fiber domain-containing protein [Ferruginibacter sp.]
MKKQLLFVLVFFNAVTSFAQWSLTGNAGTTTSNFIGTRDAQALRFRVKNVASGIIDSVSGNTALGYMSLQSSGGSRNAAFGIKSLNRVTTGNNNTAIGANTLLFNTSGSSNTAVGSEALYNNNSGIENTAIGYQALRENIYGFRNTAIGYQALLSNKDYDNTATGYQALRNNISGNNNTAIGLLSLSTNTNGRSNTATGSLALLYNTSGGYNTASGSSALAANTTGNDNTANGSLALRNHITGDNNTANGSWSLYADIDGIGNTANGSWALSNNSSGKANTAIGDSALVTNTIGKNNTALGYRADVLANNLSNATAIGNGAIVDFSNKVVIGNTAVTSIGGQVGWMVFSDGRIKKNIKTDIPGLSFINLLKPVSYNYDIKKQHTLEGRIDNTDNYEGKDDIEKIVFSGFIAQEVEEAAKKIGYTFSGIDKSGKIMGLRYSDFVVPVVKSVQELAAENEKQEKKIDELSKENQLLKEKIEKIESLLSKSSANIPVESFKKQSSTLEQNVPNPSNGSTSIGFNLTEKNSIAYINIYAQSGALAKTFKINGEGQNSITINRNELAAGVYNYVLVVNGKPIDNKKMIIE